jgi:cystathionine beta-lyase
MINSPVYSSFQGWIKEVRAEVFDVPLHRNGESWRLDLEGIEKAFAEGVKVYLLCSPQNPVGTVHSAKELAEIARLANKYEALVISDEIHAPLSWDEFTPYLALGPGAEQTGVTITSSSKAWNTAGLKAAFLITQSDRVAERLKGLPDAMHWRSSLLGAFAMAVSFKDSVGWLDETNNQIQANYEFLKKQLSQALPKASVAQMDSTYLAWIDLSAYSVENPAVEILKRGRVSLVPGEDHGGGERFKKFVRLNFATTQDRIAETVRRMALVLES